MAKPFQIICLISVLLVSMNVIVTFPLERRAKIFGIEMNPMAHNDARLKWNVLRQKMPSATAEPEKLVNKRIAFVVQINASRDPPPHVAPLAHPRKFTRNREKSIDGSQNFATIVVVGTVTRDGKSRYVGIASGPKQTHGDKLMILAGVY